MIVFLRNLSILRSYIKGIRVYIYIYTKNWLIFILDLFWLSKNQQKPINNKYVTYRNKDGTPCIHVRKKTIF